MTNRKGESMTYRERREAKAERLREWADSRDSKATALRKANEPYRGDIAFNTQPGHIPERARAIRRDDQAFEHMNKAENMRNRADGIDSQLDNSIYSDDPDAVEALEARVAALEVKREEMKARNAAYRKEHRAELKAMTPYARSQAVPHPGWEVQNLSANIKRNKDRIEQVKARQARATRAEENGGVTVEGNEYVSGTFAEKPEREILNALKAAGFYWSSGSWHGRRSELPEAVSA
jgi:hypothetical protein